VYTFIGINVSVFVLCFQKNTRIEFVVGPFVLVILSGS
jgi:hypothetical protein